MAYRSRGGPSRPFLAIESAYSYDGRVLAQPRNTFRELQFLRCECARKNCKFQFTRFPVCAYRQRHPIWQVVCFLGTHGFAHIFAREIVNTLPQQGEGGGWVG